MPRTGGDYSPMMGVMPVRISGSTFANLKEPVATTSQLPSDASAGDLRYVRGSAAFYLYTKDDGWTPMGGGSPVPLDGAIKIKAPVPTQADLPLPAAEGDMREALDTGIFYVYYTEVANGADEWIPTGGLTDLSAYYKQSEVDALLSSYAALSLLQDVQQSVAALTGRVSNNELSIMSLQRDPVPTSPDVFTYGTSSYPFSMTYEPTVVEEVLVLNGEDEFHYLQNEDYSISGTSLTINNPTLTNGMKVKIVYAR